MLNNKKIVTEIKKNDQIFVFFALKGHEITAQGKRSVALGKGYNKDIKH
ncbi:MAG: hypothetical protein JW795_14680 [Chitinivibrionales bacterium]|nr:hypothetical protein [Chitinivibrionales bacterium]